MTEREERRLEEMGLLFPKERPLPEPAVHYDREDSMYPDSIRLSFPNGKTVVYDRRIKQPGPRRYLNMPRHKKKGGGTR